VHPIATPQHPFFPLLILPGLVVTIVVLIWLLNRILFWMDEKDWVLIPNREAIRTNQQRLLDPFLESQALVEPSKRHLVEAKRRAKRSIVRANPAGDSPNRDNESLR
jgi:hypothetical protein